MITATGVGDMIRQHDAARPRSQQRTIGPSGLGHPCARNLAYHALDLDPIHQQADILPAWVGTQAHRGMEDIMRENPHWVPEVTCMIPGYRIPAHVDAYHEPTATVLDWKFVGDSALRKHRTNMSPRYRTQVHLYGFAIQASLGWPVRTVAICLIPRNGPLTGIHLWSEPYDETVVEAALERWDSILTVTGALGPGALPHIPTHPDAMCGWCPWWNPGTGTIENLALGCPGAGKTTGSAPAAWKPQQEGAPL